MIMQDIWGPYVLADMDTLIPTALIHTAPNRGKPSEKTRGASS